MRVRLGCLLAGIALLVAKGWYSGPFADGVQSYLGNVSVSFSVYFLAAIAVARHGMGRLAAAGGALLVVEIFELTDGFGGLMTNVYDPWDLLANLAGVALACATDSAFSGSAIDPGNVAPK